QRFAIHESHREECLSRDLVRAVDRNDARMRELRSDSRFAKESLTDRRVARQMWRKDLDRDEPVEPLVACAEDDAHPATPDLALDGVLAGEGGADGGELLGFGIDRRGHSRRRVAPT